jgi:ParB family chromosome partitioning protein
MKVKKPALGKGLDAILGGRADECVVPEAVAPGIVPVSRTSPDGAGSPLMVNIEKVSAGRAQPRRKFDDNALDELADSIREKGILQPLVVTPTSAGYELIAGERRLRAAARAGLASVPVIVKKEIDAGELVELALIENIQREDLTPLEQGRAYQRLVDQHHYTQEQVAKRLGKSRASIANTMRLLALPDAVRDALERGLISEGHARALLALTTAAQQITGCKTIVRKGLSVRQTEELVRAMASAGGSSSPGKRGARTDPAMSALAATLGQALGTRVQLRGNQKRGRIEIEFFSAEELNGLVDRLGR